MADLTAGPELDTEVARRIFGVEWVRHSYVVVNGRRVDAPTWMWAGYAPDDPPAGWSAGVTPPHYSTDIAAAFLIPVKLDELGLINRFCAAVVENVQGWNTGARTDPRVVVAFLVNAETAPEVICQAALRTVATQEAPDGR